MVNLEVWVLNAQASGFNATFSAKRGKHVLKHTPNIGRALGCKSVFLNNSRTEFKVLLLYLFLSISRVKVYKTICYRKQRKEKLIQQPTEYTEPTGVCVFMTSSNSIPSSKACEESQSVVRRRIKSRLGITTIKEQCMQDLYVFYWLTKNADFTARGMQLQSRVQVNSWE